MSRRHRATDDTEGGFLSRWSKRKAGTEAGGGPDPQSLEQRVESAADKKEHVEETGSTRRDEPSKTDEDMPDLDSITETTDMSDFFSPGVSEQLRTQALRRLFRMSKFNVLDGLDDYNEDFHTFELLGDLVTSDMRHRMEMEQRQRQEDESAEELAHSEEPVGGESAEDTRDGAEDDERIDSEDSARSDDDAAPGHGETADSADARSRGRI